MKIFICGGGTGGHFFSGLAFAEKFLRYRSDLEIKFVGSKRGIEARTPLPSDKMQVLFISALGVKGKSVLQKLIAFFVLGLGTFQSALYLLKVRPELVMGVGGYASAPTVFAAWLLKPFFRWKIVLLDQNSVPGMANRYFHDWLKIPLYSIFSYPGALLIDHPLRDHLEDLAQTAHEVHWPPKTILIMGGSQGARGLNERWMEIVRSLKIRAEGWNFIHQTGSRDEHSIRKAYQDLGLQAEVFAFRSNMGPLYLKADLVIGRAGALTVLEMIRFRLPTVFVPFPFAADDHQMKNAHEVQDRQWICGEPEFAAELFLRILQSPSPKIPSWPGAPRLRLDAVLPEWLGKPSPPSVA